MRTIVASLLLCVSFASHALVMTFGNTNASSYSYSEAGAKITASGVNSPSVLTIQDWSSPGPERELWFANNHGTLTFEMITGVSFDLLSFVVENTSSYSEGGTWTLTGSNGSVYTFAGNSFGTKSMTNAFKGITYFTLKGGSSQVFIDDINFDTSGVPEPVTLALLGLGFAGIGCSRRRKI